MKVADLDTLEKSVMELKRAIDLLLKQDKAQKAEIVRLHEAAGLAEAQGARDLLLYLKAECSEWNSDTDLNQHDVAETIHTVRFSDGVLSEMLALANINTWGIHAIDALASAVVAEERKLAEHSAGHGDGDSKASSGAGGD